MENNAYTNFFDALSGRNNPVGKSAKDIVEQERLMNELVPLRVSLGRPLNTKGKQIYMVSNPFNIMYGKLNKGDILFVAHETESEIGFCTKDGNSIIIIKEGNPTFTTDFLPIGICPININE